MKTGEMFWVQEWSYCLSCAVPHPVQTLQRCCRIFHADKVEKVLQEVLETETLVFLIFQFTGIVGFISRHARPVISFFVQVYN